MATTLTDLLTTQTSQTIFQTMLGVYQANGFPVQSWQTGGVERTRLMAFATATASVSGNYIPAAAGGGFLDYANTAWMRLTALELYNIVYNAAAATQGNILLTVASGSGPYSYTAGSLIAIFAASGNRYLSVGAGTLLAGPSSASVLFRAEFAGASYNDPSNSGALTLVTPLPGVTLTNPAPTFTSTAHVGSGTGTVTPTGSPVTPHQIVVRIDSTGAAGVASWSYSLDGAPYVSAGAVVSLANAGGTGITITLANGVSGTSFVNADTYTFQNPGNWITSQGSNDEADTVLALRCRSRWGSLSPVATNSLYRLLVTSTPNVGSQVTQVIVMPDSVVANQINIIVAGPAGVLPPATVALIQTYVGPRVPSIDRPVVLSPTTTNVTLAGTVTVTASQLVAAQGAIQTAMTNYIYAVGINGTVRLAAVIELIMQVAGVVDVSGITINGVAGNLVLGSVVSFVLPALQALAFTYVSA